MGGACGREEDSQRPAGGSTLWGGGCMSLEKCNWQTRTQRILLDHEFNYSPTAGAIRPAARRGKEGICERALPPAAAARFWTVGRRANRRGGGSNGRDAGQGGE